MQDYHPTIIYRHRRENLKKCSLRGLECRSDIHFFTYPKDLLPSLVGYIVLEMDAPEISAEDAGRGLCLFDATWRYAEVMANQSQPALEGTVKRSIPKNIRTAYPRRQDDCPDPELGLASVEALFVAYYILGRPTEGLLDNYFWKDSFLKQFLKLDFYRSIC